MACPCFKRLSASLLEISPPKRRPVQITTRSFSSSTRRLATLGLDALDASKGDRERIVILGSGWAGYVLSQKLASKFQTVVISPRNYFVFTPLLNSAAVGTLEFRNALEPVRNRRRPNVEYMQAWADDINFSAKTVTVEESVVDQRTGKGGILSEPDPYRNSSLTDMKMEKFGKRREGKRFEMSYDKLVVAVGCYSQTFDTKGVRENAYFMKDVGDARRIRKRVLECFEIASLPTTAESLRKQLLRFAIIGGGPTGMEFAAELSDLVHTDLCRTYPRLAPMVRITVHDVAPKVLSMFDEKLARYAMTTFQRQGVAIKTNSAVSELRRGLPDTNGDGSAEQVADAQGCYTLTTAEDGDVGVGMCVWSTGNMMNPFVKRCLRKTQRLPSSSSAIIAPDSSPPTVETLPSREWMIESHPRTGAIVVDSHLRVRLHSQPTSTSTSTTTASSTSDSATPPPPPADTAALKDVYALGDNAAMANANLPATAQTATQQAVWLAKALNSGNGNGSGVADKPFTFRNNGIMAYVGNARAIVDTPGKGTPDISGRSAWLVWRGVYLGMSVSWRNRVLIPTYWLLNWLFGRDITRF